MRMPVIFAAHGAPVPLDDEVWMSELAAWAKALPKPATILMVSARWEQRPTTPGATRAVPLVYDFYGFPEKYYETKCPSPGAPVLANRVRDLLDQRKIPWSADDRRGLDHGAYAPLLVSAGAAAGSGGEPTVTFPILGFWMDGAFTKRSVQIE